jgi:hypothetical protein
MKTNKAMITTLAGIVLLGLSQTSKAGDALLSPKAAGNQPRVAAVSQANDPDLLHPYTGFFYFSPKGVDSRETMTVGSTPKDPDLVRQSRALSSLPPKLRDTQRSVIQIAPVK